jgi:oligoendopeptidase F
VRAPLTPLQRRTPMTLAETASTFCETIVRHAALAAATPAEQLDIVEGSLQGAVGVLVDTTSRFFFEQRVLERRRARELSVAELCDLMREAQLETYADALDEDALHPYMWAAKPHYYSDESFYNYPYSFGLLFGLGLYRSYVDDPEAFCERYDDLLASTGAATAAELGAGFGADVRSEDFWRRSLEVVVEDVDRFERMLDGDAA